MSWSHYNPVRVDFGAGALRRIASHVGSEGNVLLVTTEGFVRRGQAGAIADSLGTARTTVYSGVTPNPQLDELDQATARFSGLEPVAIVALGGGSALDAGKTLSVTLPSGESNPLDRRLRGGQPQAWQRAIPVIAIPTTSGTGAEVTPFATVWDDVHHRKHSVAGDLIFPAVAILDPELTLSLPPQETLHTALDAISHSLESLWNRNRTPLSESFSAQALRLAIDALPVVLANPADLQARARMQQASMLAGMAISQTRTAIAHSISYPLTSHFGVPHGLACSFTLPNIIDRYLAEQDEPNLAPLFMAARDLLRGLDLFSLLSRYASSAQIEALKGEMFQPGRADNYKGHIEDLDDFIQPDPRPRSVS